LAKVQKSIEYLTDMVTKVPEGTSATKVDELRSAEAVRAADLASLPLHIWMQVTITPLNPHPNDPEYRASQTMDHP
jgi:muconolactone D-isomerase